MFGFVPCFLTVVYGFDTKMNLLRNLHVYQFNFIYTLKFFFFFCLWCYVIGFYKSRNARKKSGQTNMTHRKEFVHPFDGVAACPLTNGRCVGANIWDPSRRENLSGNHLRLQSGARNKFLICCSFSLVARDKRTERLVSRRSHLGVPGMDVIGRSRGAILVSQPRVTAQKPMARSPRALKCVRASRTNW